MKQHIKTLHHHPLRVTIISLIIAGAIGIYGYTKINKKPLDTYMPNEGVEQLTNTSPSQNITLGFLANGRIKSVSVKVGDKVKKGDVLAELDAGNVLGVLTQAKASYANAQANYKKVINGATGTNVNVAKAAVNTAQINLDETIKQQTLLAANAYTNLLNSTLVAKSVGDTTLSAPILTGSYTKGIEGFLALTVNQIGNGGFFSISGIVSGTGEINANTQEPILDTGLYIQFPTNPAYVGTTWKISIPNNTAPNYLTNYNAYQSALQVKDQAIASAKATLDQANANLTALVTAARPEDVAAAQAQVDNALGAVQIAEASYQNTIITAPEDGTIINVSITPGQIATPNAPAIEITNN